MLNRFVDKHSYWLGYVHAKADDNKLNANIEDAAIIEQYLKNGEKVYKDKG